MELKNESLKGILIDLEKDKDFYNAYNKSDLGNSKHELNDRKIKIV